MFIYLIQAEESIRYKIGVSKNPLVRLDTLQTGNAEKLTLTYQFKTEFGFLLEKSLHTVYNSKKVIGEWFNFEVKELDEFKRRCVQMENNFVNLKQNNLYFNQQLKNKETSCLKRKK